MYDSTTVLQILERPFALESTPEKKKKLWVPRPLTRPNSPLDS